MTPSDFQVLQAGHIELTKQVTKLAGELKENTDSTRDIKSELGKNTLSTQKIEKILTGPLVNNLQEMSNHFDALKGGLTVLGWIGKFGEKLLWLGIPGALILTGWSHIKAWLPWIGKP